MNFDAGDAIRIVEGFDASEDGMARKSRELTLHLLRHTPAPFSRSQFEPGHITCTALVRHPFERRFLAMFHHRLKRWLLPGGHVEADDPSLALSAAREAREETGVAIDPRGEFRLVGIDVHGIPPKPGEPCHLHHDLIWSFRAVTDYIETTDEAPEVLWAAESDFDRLGIAESIRRCALR